MIVQPFEGRIRLGPNGEPENDVGRLKPSFTLRWLDDPRSIHSSELAVHGSPGYAWAARRSLLNTHGLYDCWLSGTGDHMMAHAMVGDFDGPCIRGARLARPKLRTERVIQRSKTWQALRRFIPSAVRALLWQGVQAIPSPEYVNQPFWEHFLAWAHPFYNQVRGRLAYTPGNILHLWHGAGNDRSYSFSQSEFNRFGFDPKVDLRLGASGCWEWGSDKPELHRWAAQFFEIRKEDG
jgi:hypothetical protein